MKFYFKPRDIADAVNTLIRADVTLQGANYLNGTNKCFVGRAPNDIAPPVIAIEVPIFTPNEMQEYSGEIRIFCYTDLLGNGQIDYVGDNIISRCEEILNNKNLVVANVDVQPLFSLGTYPNIYDPADTDETKSKSVLRLRVTTGRTD